jgi:uncharacterized membrane protein YkoI
MTRIFPAAFLIFSAVAVAGTASALAEALTPETARTLTERGDVLPLAEVLNRAGVEGEIIGVALHREEGRYVYTIKVLGQGGQYREYEVDAKNGTFLDSDRRR